MGIYTEARLKVIEACLSDNFYRIVRYQTREEAEDALANIARELDEMISGIPGR